MAGDKPKSKGGVFWLLLPFVCLSLVTLGIGVNLWFYADSKLNTDDINALGAYGSYLQGTVGSLWALSGVILVAGAFVAQARQLSLQRQQLAEQENQFKKQFESLKTQNFEASFFQLLNLHSELVTQLRAGGGDYEGRGVFEYWRSGFNQDFQAWLTRRNHHPPIEGNERDKLLVASYLEEEYIPSRQVQMGLYFGHLFQVINFADEKAPASVRDYVSLARAQLSRFELLFLFYYSLTRFHNGLRPLVENYGLLKYLDTSLLFHPSFEGFYPNSAYEKL
jgi:hypothetical protein